MPTIQKKKKRERERERDSQVLLVKENSQMLKIVIHGFSSLTILSKLKKKKEEKKQQSQ